MNPYVRSLAVLPGYQLHLTFDNNEQRIFDLTPLLERGVFKRLQDPAIFRGAKVVAGSVEWPLDVDLSHDTLYLQSRPVRQPAVS